MGDEIADENTDISRRNIIKTTLAASALGQVVGGVQAKQHTNSQEQQSTDEPSDRYIVGTRSSGGATAASARASSVEQVLDFGEIGGAVVGQYRQPDLDALGQSNNVRYVERDGRYDADDQTLPWGIDRIDADKTIAAEDTGTGAHVAILDSGIDQNHPDLQPRLGTGKSFVDYTSSWDDDKGHGTHCAGIAAASDNTQGVVGTAPTSTLHAGKVLNDNGWGRWSWIAAGIEWAADQGYDVISMSISGSDYSQTLKDACAYAHDEGVLIVASAGNDSRGSVNHPADFQNVLAVSSITENDKLSNFSNIGSEIELAAPGSDIYSTVPDGYGYNSGTSMACPHVSGVGGLLMSPDGDSLSNIEARQRLHNTAEDIGLDDTEQGYGLVDAEAAVSEPSGGQPNTLSIEGSGGRTSYSFTVSGDIQAAENITPEDNITNNNRSASGAVGSGTDTYTFDGNLKAFDLDGTANILLDGQPARVGRRPDHLLQIQGQGSRTNYRFTVSSNLQGAGDLTPEDNITSDRRSASGAVGGGADTYTFDGGLQAFDLDGTANVLLDGKPAHVGRRPDST